MSTAAPSIFEWTQTLRALAGDAFDRWPHGSAPLKELDAWATIHGLDALLGWHLSKPGVPDEFTDLAKIWNDRRTRFAFVEALWLSQLNTLTQSWPDLGIESLVIKGGALALTHYFVAGTRVRGDVDLWVASANRFAAERALGDAGGATRLQASGHHIQPERNFRFALVTGINLDVDLHWAANSQPGLAAGLCFSDIYSRSLADERLGNIRMPCPVDALHIAAAHLIGHHQGDQSRLIWLLDLAKLWQAFSTNERDEVVSLAVQRGMACIVLAAMNATIAAGFNVEDWESYQPKLAIKGDKERARFLLLQAEPAWWRSLRASPLKLWPAIIRDYVWPGKIYLKAKMGHAKMWQWPWIYLRRAFVGLRK
jgi:Uncharacterised nucleotidyltransferase